MTRAIALPPLVRKEIRALLPLWAGTVAVVVVAALWRGGAMAGIGLFAYIAGSLAIGAQSIGQEYAYRTLPMLLAQPADRRRVFLVKFAAAAALLLLLALVATALAAAVETPRVRSLTIMVPVLCGLFLAPLVTMWCRNTLAGMVISAQALSAVWLVALAVAWFGLGIDPDAMERLVFDRWASIAWVVCPMAGALAWRRFIALETAAATAGALAWRRRPQRGVRRYAPLRALIGKELHLQQLSCVVAALYVVIWTLLSLAQTYIPSWSTFPLGSVMLMYCVGLTIVAGALGSAEERQHGTVDAQILQPLHRRRQWVVKAAVTVGLALAFGIALPYLANTIATLKGVQTGPGLIHLTTLVVVLTSSSLYASSLSGSGVRAMALWLPMALGTAIFVQTVNRIIDWRASQLLGVNMSELTPAAIFAARAVLLALSALLLWLGFHNHSSADRSGRQLATQAALIAAVVAGGVVLFRVAQSVRM